MANWSSDYCVSFSWATWFNKQLKSSRTDVLDLSDMFPTPIEKTIKKICNDKTVKSFLKANKVNGGLLYQCRNLSVYGTQYMRHNYIVLPGSRKNNMQFGKIVELLCSTNYAYFKYEETTATYCPDSDLHFVQGEHKYKVIAQHHLPDYRLEVLSRLLMIF